MSKRPLRCPECGGTVSLRETAMDLGPYECDDRFDCGWSHDDPPAHDDRPEVSDRDLDDLLITAVRYSLGRATYMVWHTVQQVVEHEPWLSDRARQVMVRDIRYAFTASPTGDVGMSMDTAQWRRALEVLDPDNQVAGLPATLETSDDVRTVCEHYGLRADPGLIHPGRGPWSGPTAPYVCVHGALPAYPVMVSAADSAVAIEKGTSTAELVDAITRGLAGRKVSR